MKVDNGVSMTSLGGIFLCETRIFKDVMDENCCGWEST